MLINVNSAKICIMGFGTCGKGTCAKYLAHRYGLRYEFSTSQFAQRVVTLPGDKFENREGWGQAIADFNNEDPDGIKLYKLMAETHDIFDGVRRQNELAKLALWLGKQQRHLITVWIDRDVPVDPSCDIRPEHCMFTISNRGSMADLMWRLQLFWEGVGTLLCQAET